MDLAATQYLLGIRPELDGLRLAPVLPPDWNGFSAARRFRGCALEITVARGPTPRLTLDGDVLEDNLVPAARLRGKSTVHAHLVVA
jgi:cellobiose phosphorylase